jgi:DNA polymerase-1
VTSPSSRPLLAVDGDSFAHRAYHALPSSIARANGRPGNALTGFMSMLLRLWEAERPRSVVVGWDSIGEPTYRNEILPTYQSGREFDAEILEQLDLLPGLVSSTGIVCAKVAGYEADDLLAAAAVAEQARGRAVLVATSDRDAYQLVGDGVTILQPTKGVSELARIDAAGVGERYGVRPDQVVDFIALRGDPSDRIPGARGIGEKKAAQLLQEFGSLEAILAAGRFATEADDLRRYAHIARMDSAAPLPALPDCEPDWAAAAAAAAELGLVRLARTLDEAAARWS